MNPSHQRIYELLLENLVWVLLLAVLVVFSIAIPNFFQFGIFANILEQSTYVGVMSIGLAIVIISGNLDLSIESIAALSAMVTGILFASSGVGMGLDIGPAYISVPVSAVIAIAVGMAIGFINGFFIIKVGMSAFIVTLASFIWVRGLVVAISGGRSAQNLDQGIRGIGIERVLDIPLLAWISLATFLVFSFIMAKTPFGRYVTLVGGNEVATYRSGIPSKQILWKTFVLAGALAGLAGWLLAIRTSGATANLGTGMLFNAFAAVVIGGVSLKGGMGKLPGVYAGVLLIYSIHTAINLMRLPAHWTQVILGLLVLAAVLLDTVKLRLREKLL